MFSWCNVTWFSCYRLLHAISFLYRHEHIKITSQHETELVISWHSILAAKGNSSSSPAARFSQCHDKGRTEIKTEEEQGEMKKSKKRHRRISASQQGKNTCENKKGGSSCASKWALTHWVCKRDLWWRPEVSGTWVLAEDSLHLVG